MPLTVIDTQQNTADFAARVQSAVQAYTGDLVRLAFTYVQCVDDAEDIVQDVFLNYWKVKPALQGPQGEKAWLLRCTINRAKDVLRAGWYRNREELSEEIPAATAEEHEVLDAVLALDEKYRTPIHLHYYGGYSIQEIAEITGVKPATIGTRLARGREQLKAKLGEWEDE